MPILAAWTPADAVLDALVPLGLVAAIGSGLVIDLDPEGPTLGQGPSLADLVADGPTEEQLSPNARGSAYLANGGVDASDAGDVVAALAERWPATVLRCPPRQPRPNGAIAFLPLLPEPFALHADGRCVYQRTGVSPKHPPDGPVLPLPRRATVIALLGGVRPPRRDRWLRAIGHIWDAT